MNSKHHVRLVQVLAPKPSPQPESQAVQHAPETVSAFSLGHCDTVAPTLLSL